MVYEHLAKHPAISRVEVTCNDGVERIVYLDNDGNILEIEDETLATVVEEFACEGCPEGWDTGTVVIDITTNTARFLGHKAMVYEQLKQHPTISRVEVGYDGSCDQGQVEEIVYRDTDGNALDIKDESLASAIEELVYAHLPLGWEIDCGSYGTVVIDVTEKKVHFEHNQRYDFVKTSIYDIG